MIIQRASGRSWRIESVRTLGYGEQGGPQVWIQGMVAIQLKIQEGRGAVGDGLRTHGNCTDLQLNSGRTGHTGHSDDVSGVRTQGGRI